MGGRSKSGKPGEMPKGGGGGGGGGAQRGGGGGGGGGRGGWLTMGWSGIYPRGLGSHSQSLHVRKPGL